MRHKTRFTDLILWEDDDFIVINKPPHVATLEDRVESFNILSVARRHVNTAQVCHRLDKDTSGTLVIAKNPEAYRHLAMQFENRTVNKVYHAVVDGVHSFENLFVDKPIVKKDDGTARIGKEGKDAKTYFSSLQSYRVNTLVECRPVTGRMHQIRIHLTLLGTVITGDEMYGGKPFYLSSVKSGFNLKKGEEEQPIMKRMALHAFQIEFNDLSGRLIAIEAPYPKDFQALVRQLELNR